MTKNVDEDGAYCCFAHLAITLTSVRTSSNMCIFKSSSLPWTGEGFLDNRCADGDLNQAVST